MPTKIEKNFDCIEFKRRAQERIYEETKGMTREQEIQYFRRAVENGPFADLVKRLKAKENNRN